MKKLLVALVALVLLVGSSFGGTITDDGPVWGDVAKLHIIDTDGSGSCSGWMFTETELVTAGHCTKNLVSVTACFYPGPEECANPVPLTLVGVDLVRDVAVFKVPAGQTYRPVEIRGNVLRVGERVYIVGFPEGVFAVTEGLYSQTHPAEPLWNDVVVSWLQHSVGSAPGSSGGSLVDAQGRLVGMHVGVQHFGPYVHFEFGIAVPVHEINVAVYRIMHGLVPPPPKPEPPATPTACVFAPRCGI